MYRDMTLNRGQKRLEKALCKDLYRAKKGREAENEQQWEAVVEDAHLNSRPYFVTGPPGTGKTTVVDKCVRRWGPLHLRFVRRSHPTPATRQKPF